MRSEAIRYLGRHDVRLRVDIGHYAHRQEVGEPAVAQVDGGGYRERDDAAVDRRTVLEPP